MDYVTTSALHFAYQSTAVWWLIAQLFKAWPIWLQWLCNWVSIWLSPNQFELGCISHTCKKGFFYRFSLAFFFFFFGLSLPCLCDVCFSVLSWEGTEYTVKHPSVKPKLIFFIPNANFYLLNIQFSLQIVMTLHNVNFIERFFVV